MQKKGPVARTKECRLAPHDSSPPAAAERWVVDARIPTGGFVVNSGVRLKF